MGKEFLISTVTAIVLLSGCAEASKEQNTTNASSSMQQEATKAKEAVEQKAKEVGKAAASMASEAKKAVEQKAQEAKEAVEQKAKEVGKAAASMASEAKKAVEQKAQEAKEAVEQKAKTTFDEAKAKRLYAKCAACHGQNGKTKAMGKSAIIAGQSADELEKKLKGYKEGKLNVSGMGTVMKTQAAPLSDEDIKILAQYISNLK